MAPYRSNHFLQTSSITNFITLESVNVLGLFSLANLIRNNMHYILLTEIPIPVTVSNHEYYIISLEAKGSVNWYEWKLNPFASQLKICATVQPWCDRTIKGYYIMTLYCNNSMLQASTVWTDLCGGGHCPLTEDMWLRPVVTWLASARWPNSVHEPCNVMDNDGH